jgi:signal transduction histidine kinase
MEQQVLLTNKLASIGELASGVAHELNNPLTTVMGYAQLLVESKDVPENIKSDLDKVYQESQRAAKIVQNLLSFARRRRPEKTYFDINYLVQKTLDLRSYELKVNNISVFVNLIPDMPEIKADYHQIQQVILNILINAEQALTEMRRRGKITVTTSAVKDHIRINIADNGPGISKNNINRIFDPFFTTRNQAKVPAWD